MQNNNTAIKRDNKNYKFRVNELIGKIKSTTNWFDLFLI